MIFFVSLAPVLTRSQTFWKTLKFSQMTRYGTSGFLPACGVSCMNIVLPAPVFFTSLQDDVGGPQHAIISMLDAPALVALGMTSRCWRMSEHWFEHWYLLGVKEFGTQRRLVPPGKFERFDEAVFAADMDWHLRYGNFVMAARLSIETFHNAVLSIVFSLDLETSGVEEVRQRLSEELQLGSNFLSIECVEQLLEDATTMRSLGARQEYVPDDVAGEM